VNSEKFHNLHSPPNIITATTRSRIRRAGHVARVRDEELHGKEYFL
jgi:hypothetical protein